jgi:hypothetical protein
MMIFDFETPYLGQKFEFLGIIKGIVGFASSLRVEVYILSDFSR